MKPDCTSSTGHISVLPSLSTHHDNVKSIVQQQNPEEAFFICDVGNVVKKFKNWRLKLPRVTPFYAVKCNASRTVLRVLAALGTGFDCASKVEIEKILSIGVDADRIIFANPVKQMSHIRHAAACNVDLMTFDNKQELFKVKRFYEDARLVLRIRCDAAVAQCQLGMKFGIEPHQALPLLTTARELGLNVVGVSFHVGSGCKDVLIFAKAIKLARWIFDEAHKLGFEMKLLDIGGGFPGDQGSSLDKFSAVINTALDTHFPIGCGIDIIAEPGRYFVASAFTLATSVVGCREVWKDERQTYMYYINDGAYGSFNCLLYDHAVVHPKPLEIVDEVLYASSVWGPTCDGLDQVNAEVLLPQLNVGDWLLYEDMGAYTLAAASGFNGFPVPSIYYVVDEKEWKYLHEEKMMPEGLFVVTDSSSSVIYTSVPASTKSSPTPPTAPPSLKHFFSTCILQETPLTEIHPPSFPETFISLPASS